MTLTGGRSGRGPSGSQPPTAWAILIYFVVALSVVTVYLPMAWDRYFLPIQAPAALLAGLVVARWPRRDRSFAEGMS